MENRSNIMSDDTFITLMQIAVVILFLAMMGCFVFAIALILRL